VAQRWAQELPGDEAGRSGKGEGSGKAAGTRGGPDAWGDAHCRVQGERRGSAGPGWSPCPGPHLRTPLWRRLHWGSPSPAPSGLDEEETLCVGTCCFPREFSTGDNQAHHNLQLLNQFQRQEGVPTKTHPPHVLSLRAQGPHAVLLCGAATSLELLREQPSLPCPAWPGKMAACLPARSSQHLTCARSCHRGPVPGRRHRQPQVLLAELLGISAQPPAADAYG